jgi:Na+-transporting methylmalonyl-CoA/oxaloacetate decarboxylase gamma subunit
MQRVRIGLTGLAIVFLFVLLVASIGRWAGEEPPANASANAANNTAEPNEPLAELGVAPGDSSAKNASQNKQ